MKEISVAYERFKHDPGFLADLSSYRKEFIGRPSPIFYCENLSRKVGGAQIYLKREDINHTGSHKINHCLAEALLAKKMGKKKLLAEKEVEDQEETFDFGKKRKKKKDKDEK